MCSLPWVPLCLKITASPRRAVSQIRRGFISVIQALTAVFEVVSAFHFGELVEDTSATFPELDACCMPGHSLGLSRADCTKRRGLKPDRQENRDDKLIVAR